MPSRTVDQLGEPGGKLWKQYDDRQTDELKNDKRNNTPVYMTGCNFRRCHRFQIEQGKPERRRHERCLQVYRQQNTEPDGIEPELDHDRRQHRHMNEGYFDKIEKKTNDKDQPHDNGQYHTPGVLISQTA